MDMSLSSFFIHDFGCLLSEGNKCSKDIKLKNNIWKWLRINFIILFSFLCDATLFREEIDLLAEFTKIDDQTSFCENIDRYM